MALRALRNFRRFGMGKLKWGIIGTGNIAHSFARGLDKSQKCELLAVGSRSIENAKKFADEFKVKKFYGSYEDLLSDPSVEAVYISTPHPQHAEWAIKAAQAKKHILCEKPIGINYPEALAIVEAAKENDVFLMEAFMYRCHPQTKKLVELLKAKAIGEVRVIHASFSFSASFKAESRLFSNDFAGGGILDVGSYCVSMSRLIAGVANGKDFEEPLEVKAVGKIGPTGVDEYTSAVLMFPGNITASISTGITVSEENVVRIFGTEGSIFIPSPWFCGFKNTEQGIYIKTKQKQEKITIESDNEIYAIEADTVADNISRRKALSPAMTPEDTLGNMKTCDLWRMAINCIYEMEKPNANIPTASRQPLAVKKINKMKYLTLPHLSKKVSQIVMGTMLEGRTIDLPYASVMYDDFFSRGGNCFDTAYVYGSGRSEKLLGQWIKNRNIRNEVVVIGKGAHTPHCNPESLVSQLKESLERLQTDFVDIYMLHRDNLEIPVGAFVDVLNKLVKEGKIKTFGGSNWSIQRVVEANAYAKKNGLQGFTCMSNNFSLARLIEPMWAGCIAASDQNSKKWLNENHFANFAWSSQARGFFSGRAHPDYKGDAELSRCWYSEDNFKRLQRAEELAKKKGVTTVTIAAAYVLSQGFPSFALIGPRTLEEIRTTLDAFDVNLSKTEVEYLNLEI